MTKKHEITNEDVLMAILALRQELEPHVQACALASGPDLDILRREMQDLRDFIRRTNMEIAAIKHPKAREDRIDSATHELDAIIGATEVATNDILQQAEEIERLAERIRDNVKDEQAVNIADQITDHAMRLFEACGFQDITGQRVAKVVSTLRYVEERVLSIIRIWGEDEFDSVPLPTSVPDDSDARLLNGPQLKGGGIDQSLVDQMFD